MRLCGYARPLVFHSVAIAKIGATAVDEYNSIGASSGSLYMVALERITICFDNRQ